MVFAPRLTSLFDVLKICVMVMHFNQDGDHHDRDWYGDDDDIEPYPNTDQRAQHGK